MAILDQNSNLKNSMKDTKGTLIHGVASAQTLDSTGERIDIKNLDITSLLENKGFINYEHKSDSPNQRVGKIVFSKKIFSPEECENEAELKFWNRTKAPLLYIIAELFDADGKHESAVAVASVFRQEFEKCQKDDKYKGFYGFSVEGQTLEKNGGDIAHAVARGVTVTSAPANKVCIAELYLPEAKSDPLDFLKSESIPIDIKKALTAAMGNGAPSTLSGGAALQGEIIDKKLYKEVSDFVSKRFAKKPDLEKSNLIKALYDRMLQKAEDEMVSLFKNTRSPKKGHTIAQLQGLREAGWYNANTGYEMSEGEGEQYLNQMMQNRANKQVKTMIAAQNKPKKPSSNPTDWFDNPELEKSKNVREERKRIFGETGEPNPDRKTSKLFYQKQADALNLLAQKRYGMPISESKGKYQYSLKDINKIRLKQNKPPLTMEEVRNHPDYTAANPAVSTVEPDRIRLNQQKANPKPDWRSGELQAQRHIGAKAHELGHLEIADQGLPIGDIQSQMDMGSSVAGSKFKGMPKQTEYEVQPMAAEELLRRRAGVPQFGRPQYNDPRRGHGTEPLTEESPERVTLDTQRLYGKRFKDSEGNPYDLVGMGSNLSEQNRSRMKDVDEGVLKFHPETGWLPSNSTDALINLRGQGRKQEAEQRLRQKFTKNEGAQPKKMIRPAEKPSLTPQVSQKQWYQMSYNDKKRYLASKERDKKILSGEIPSMKDSIASALESATFGKKKDLNKSASAGKANYKYHHLLPKSSQGPESLHTVVAMHGKNAVGELSAEPVGGKHFSVNMVEVHPEHQGKGIASSMYKLLERNTGKTAIPDLEAMTDDGKKLWSRPHHERGFGPKDHEFDFKNLRLKTDPYKEAM